MSSTRRSPPLLPVLGAAAQAGRGILKLLEDRYEFRDKVVLVTGGSRGLGWHAEEFDRFAGGMGSLFTSMGNDRAARLILGACRAGRPYISIGTQAKAARIFSGLFPNLTAYGAALANRLTLPPPGADAGANVPPKGRESRAPGSTGNPRFTLADEAAARFNGGGINGKAEG